MATRRRRVPYWPLKLDLKNPKAFEQAVNENFRQIFEGDSELPRGTTRDALIHDGTGWKSLNLDTFFWLGTGVWDGFQYTVDPPYPPTIFNVTGIGGMGTAPPNLNKPLPGTLAYFRADAENTGPAYLNVHVDLPDISGFGPYEIIDSAGEPLVPGDIPEGAIVLCVWDSIWNGEDPAAEGEQKWRLVLAGGIPSEAPGAGGAGGWTHTFMTMGG